MTAIAFTVPAVPIAQPRPRATIRKFGDGKLSARVYNKETHPVAAFKATCRLAASKAHQGPPLKGPLVVRLVFVMPRPKAMLWKKKPMPAVEHTVKPDVDNLTKALFDALNGVAWVDDSQVWSKQVDKIIASGYESPCVLVRIRECTLEDAAADEVLDSRWQASES